MARFISVFRNNLKFLSVGLALLVAVGLIFSLNNKNLTRNFSALGLFNLSKATNSCACPKDEQAKVIDLVKKNSPAVVSIVASGEVPTFEQCLPNTPIPDSPDTQTITYCQNGVEMKRIGAGTGFILSADGYIATNKHVVEDENAKYYVFLNDEKNLGKKLVATVLARDPIYDIAILKVEFDHLPYITFGDSSQVQVGQSAVAIGYALGEYNNSVSKGVISGLSRSLEAAGGLLNQTRKFTGLIQTDAAINLGNSGGPLLNLDGQVIGMNTAMAEAQSIGFALPINLVKIDFDQVKKTGTIAMEERAYLGVWYVPVTEELMFNLKLPYDYGMLIARNDQANEPAIIPGSPAEQAGLVEGDMILKANGRELNESYTLSDAINELKPGFVIKLTVLHEGKILEKNITLGVKPAQY